MPPAPPALLRAPVAPVPAPTRQPCIHNDYCRGGGRGRARRGLQSYTDVRSLEPCTKLAQASMVHFSKPVQIGPTLAPAIQVGQRGRGSASGGATSPRRLPGAAAGRPRRAPTRRAGAASSAGARRRSLTPPTVCCGSPLGWGRAAGSIGPRSLGLLAPRALFRLPLLTELLADCRCAYRPSQRPGSRTLAGASLSRAPSGLAPAAEPLILA